MKKLIILLLICTSCLSVQESKEEKFEKDGISFTSPSGWEITEREEIEDQGYYLCVEKDGFDSSGIITFTWVYGELDMNEWIAIHKEELQENVIFKNSDLTFGPLNDGTYNGINTQVIKYTVSILGLKHEGFMHFFYKNGKTFSVSLQEALEDRAKNKSGFESIEKSFAFN